MHTSEQLSQPNGRLQILNYLLKENREETGREIIAGLTHPRSGCPANTSMMPTGPGYSKGSVTYPSIT